MSHILYLEDNPSLRLKNGIAIDSISSVTRDTFQSVEDFQASHKDINWKNPPYDMVVTDNFMGGKTGIELAREIRKENPSIPIILLTSDPMESLRKSMSDFDDLHIHYLQKPGDKDQLVSLITSQLPQGFNPGNDTMTKWTR